MLHCAFSKDGKALASASKDKTARLYKIKPGTGEFVPGTEIKLLAGHKGAVNVVQFSPDNELLFTGSEDGMVMVWNRKEGLRVEQVECFGRVKNLHFWPNEPFFATLSENRIEIWSVHSYKLKNEMEVRSEKALEVRLGRGAYYITVHTPAQKHTSCSGMVPHWQNVWYRVLQATYIFTSLPSLSTVKYFVQHQLSVGLGCCWVPR